MIRIFLINTILLFAAMVPAWAQFGDFFEQLKAFGIEQPRGLSELSDMKIESGLKEALQVGTQNAANLTGQLDGFLGNEAIKILMPEKLQTLDQALRMVGYGSQLDEFVVSMNRAAEQAVPLAKPIFEDAIKQMSFEDVKQIFNGGDTAATDYFKEKTSDELAVAFRPKVEQTMNQVGVTQQYKELVGRYSAIPFVKSEMFDLDQYVVNGGLDGLFHVLAEEERKIRTDPTARVTDLLKEVFAKK